LSDHLIPASVEGVTNDEQHIEPVSDTHPSKVTFTQPTKKDKPTKEPKKAVAKNSVTTTERKVSKVHEEQEDISDLLVLKKDALIPEDLPERQRQPPQKVAKERSEEQEWALVKRSNEVETLRKRIADLEEELEKAKRKQARQASLIDDLRSEKSDVSRQRALLEKKVKQLNAKSLHSSESGKVLNYTQKPKIEQPVVAQTNDSTAS
jgi:chromosome segregation ATPase